MAPQSDKSLSSLMDSNYTELSDQYSTKSDEYYEGPRPEMALLIPRSATRVIDVGCGGGAFGVAVKEILPNCSVWGIEPDTKAASIASKRLDRVINSTFSADLGELQNVSFDAIVFNDVLEHMVSPEKALLDCKSFLKPNGLVIASIPNILFWPAIYQIVRHQDWKYEESGIFDSTHLRFFTKKSIIRMFGICGFNVESIAGLNPLIGWQYTFLNSLLLNRISDWKFLQFAVVASIRPDLENATVKTSPSTTGK